MVMISGTSMLPTYQSGGIVFAVAQDTYSLGDVIVYHPESLPCDACNIVHRIVEGNGVDGYHTLGDNNEAEDVWHPIDEEVIGKVQFYLEIGKISLFVANKNLWVTMIFIAFALIAGIYAYENAKKIWLEDEDEDGEGQEHHKYNAYASLLSAIEEDMKTNPNRSLQDDEDSLSEVIKIYKDINEKKLDVKQ